MAGASQASRSRIFRTCLAVKSNVACILNTTAKRRSEVPPQLGAADLPLVVDLDGTLLRTDLLHEATLYLIKQKPLTSVLMPLWLLRGRASLKRRVFEMAESITLCCRFIKIS